MAGVECKHMNLLGLTTNYQDFVDKDPEITCMNCNQKISVEEWQKLFEHVTKCHEEGIPYVEVLK